VTGKVPVIHPDLQLLLSTSGTTGSRKLVRLSATNIESNAAAIAAYLELTPDERPITSLPLHYTFGLSILDSHWLAGACVVLTTESLVQGAFWDILRAHGCTSLAGVPYTYLMLERIGFRGMDLPSLRTLQQAGGALDRRLTATYAEHMARRGGRFFVMYGQTEATARMAYVPPDRLAEKLGSAGIAIPGGRLRIEHDEHDGDGGADRTSRAGEVVFEGPNVMLGYASGPDDLALGDQLDGVLHTGDIGYLDDEGFLFLVGRSKRIAKVFGLRLNLDEVEATLREHGPAAVVGTGDALWAFCAFGTDASLLELRASLARRYRLHRSALNLRRVDAIPTSTSGKVDYATIQAWLPDDAGAPEQVSGMLEPTAPASQPSKETT
jgi:acyl-CoA synthetase (AMP-forming)/AMP-acid ligase II